MTQFFVGLDLGQLSDYTAIAIAERVMEVPKNHVATLPWQSGHPLSHLAHQIVDQPLSVSAPKASYQLRHLQRFPLKTSYPAIVASVKVLVSRPELHADPEESLVLAVDSTGVGVAVHNMLEEAELPCQLYGISIHGGSEVTQDGMHYSVPKRDLITLTQVLLQNERLKIAQGLPESSTLVKELLTYRLKIDQTTMHDSYNAREGAHDDLVLAVALSVWIGEEIGGYEPRARWLQYVR